MLFKANMNGRIDWLKTDVKWSHHHVNLWLSGELIIMAEKRKLSKCLIPTYLFKIRNVILISSRIRFILWFFVSVLKKTQKLPQCFTVQVRVNSFVGIYRITTYTKLSQRRQTSPIFTWFNFSHNLMSGVRQKVVRP